MELALADPQYGYYMTRDPFGTAGDFTTAPEISQMFGELIGLWAAEVWTSMGRPNPVRLIELGPGRGTLMSDALRAARVVPEFRAALDVTLIETSPPLAQIQYDALLTAGAPIAWRASFAEAPDGPAIVLANEFLDALPVRQFVRRGGQWRERVVRLDGAGELAFGVADKPEPYINARGATTATSRGQRRRAIASCSSSAARLAKQGGAALFLDYGHAVTGFGDTLQALRAHRSGRSADRARRMRPHRACRFRRDGAQRARRRRGGPWADRPGRFPARARHRRARPRARRARARARRRNRGGAPPPGRQGRRRDGRAVQGDGGRQPRRADAARLPAQPRRSRRDGGRVPQRRDARAARRRARVLHPPRRRLRGRLRFAQRRRRLARRRRRRCAENRARMAAALGVAPERLAIPYQVHSPDALAITAPFAARSAAALRRARHRDAGPRRSASPAPIAA